MNWHSLQLKEIIQGLETNSKQGLDEREVVQRIQKFGLNQLEEKKESIFKKILEPFTEPMMLLLIGTGIIYSLLGELSDSIAIFIIIAIIGLVEFLEEWRTEKAIHALKRTVTPLTKVIRNSREKRVLSIEIVPGDLIVMDVGDIIPADARLIEVVNLRMEESTLTGESIAVDKNSDLIVEDKTIISEMKNMVFAGTSVVHGKGKGIVVNTGMNTEMGKIAELVQNVEEEPSPLQKRMKQLTFWFLLVSLSLCSVVVALGIFQGEGFIQTLLFGLSLAVATIPEDLPIILIVILVFGVRRMAKHRALVKKLHSVETLGSTTIICSDKTGTLTQNKMRVVLVYSDGKMTKLIESNEKDILESVRFAFKIGVLCNDAIIQQNKVGRVEILGDPMEKALIDLSYEFGIEAQSIRNKNKLLTEFSFDSQRKLMTTIYQVEDKTIQVFTKGAPEMLIDKCDYVFCDGKIISLEKKEKEDILLANEDIARQGLRVIGTAFKSLNVKNISLDQDLIEQDLVFVALFGMIDPPRKEAKGAIAKCHQAGIKIKMITGDHKLTALTIAKELELSQKNIILSGQELDVMNEKDFEKVVKDIDIYARVSPEHKLRIVRALKKNGEVIAMTGDGINDAPALKQADIGIAMGKTGTDVAREASTMVLSDDNFATIVRAVEEGRKISVNLQKAVICYISYKMAVLGIALTIILFQFPLPFLPIQIILMEVLSDVIISTAFESEVPEADLMKHPPRKPGEFVLSKKQQFRIMIQALIIIMGILFIYVFTLNQGFSLERARTVAFATTLFSLVFLIFNSRSDTQSLFEIGFLSNKNLTIFGLTALTIGILSIQIPFFQTIFKTVALTPPEWMLILISSFLMTFWIEIIKIIRKYLYK
ncbi:MAG: cation-translocating P-type ATPase [Candidatus Odinarchaeota archaeon]